MFQHIYKGALKAEYAGFQADVIKQPGPEPLSFLSNPVLLWLLINSSLF